MIFAGFLSRGNEKKLKFRALLIRNLKKLRRGGQTKNKGGNS